MPLIEDTFPAVVDACFAVARIWVMGDTAVL
jgi:hypothetical protein